MSYSSMVLCPKRIYCALFDSSDTDRNQMMHDYNGRLKRSKDGLTYHSPNIVSKLVVSGCSFSLTLFPILYTPPVLF